MPLLRMLLLTHLEIKVVLGWGDIKKILSLYIMLSFLNWDTLLPQTWWLETTYVYFLTILRVLGHFYRLKIKVSAGPRSL